MSPGQNDDTARRRRPTVDDSDSDGCGGWHDRLVEFFGADQRGGEWSRAVKVVEQIDERVSALEQLKWKLFGMVTFGGVVAGLATVIIGWAIGLYGKH